jgi:hypothetical protein
MVILRAIEHTGIDLAGWMATPRQSAAPTPAASGPLKGERVAILGEARDGRLAHLIAQAGGQVVSSVGLKTTMLIVASFPDFGADLAGGAKEDGTWEAIISADTSLDPMAIARLIQRCCQESLGQAPIGFEWAVTCSRQRIGEFGGGWCAIFPDRIEIETTTQLLSLALSEQSD